MLEGPIVPRVDRGLRAILSDCCASATEEAHNFSVEVILPDLCTVTTADEMIQLLARSP